MKQMIIKLDDDYTETVEGLSIHGQLVGSKSWFNKILVLAQSDLTESELSDLFAELELSWDIIAVEVEPLDGDEFTNFMNDILEFDEEGEEINSAEFSDLSIIQTFAGRKWTL